MQNHPVMNNRFSRRVPTLPMLPMLLGSACLLSLALACVSQTGLAQELERSPRPSAAANRTSESELVSDPASVLARPVFETNDAVLKIIEEREIPSLTSGLLRQSHVTEGTLVKLGELVAEIDSKLARLDLSKLEKELEIAKQEAATRVELEYVRRSIEVAQADLDRATQTNQRLPGAIARTEIDQLNLLVQKSIAEKDKTEFQITQKQLLTEVRSLEVAVGKRKLSDHQINAPISGMVVEVFKRQGEWVEASEAIARMVQLDRLKTEVKLPASIALNGLLGSSAEFVPSLPSLSAKRFPAKVIFVHPEANPVNASVRVWVEIENKSLELVPGLTGSLRIFAKPPGTSDTVMSPSKQTAPGAGDEPSLEENAEPAIRIAPSTGPSPTLADPTEDK